MVDRLLLRVYSFLVAASVVWTALWLLGFPSVHYATSVLIWSNWLWGFIALLFLLSGRYLFFGLQKRAAHSFVKTTENGEVRIGFSAVNELSRRAAMQIRGVTRLSTNVQESAEGLVVWIKVRVESGVDLTALSDQMQQEVAQAIRSATSLAVHAVHVQISDLAPLTPQK